MSVTNLDVPAGATDLSPTRIAFALAGITLAGLALRLIGLTGASLWTDELFSVLWSRQPLAFLWGTGMAVETNPPLYYSLLHAWMALFGDGEAAVRMLSVSASVATIPAVFCLLREMTAPRTALLAAGLFAVAPVQVAYAQEARTYALLPLLMALATLGLLRFARHGGWRPLSLHAAAAVLLCYSHATSGFALAALNLGGLAALLSAPDRRRRVARWLAANLLVALAALPMLRASAMLAGSDNIAWIPPPNAHLAFEILAVLLVDPATPQAHFRLTALIAGALLLALLGSLARRPPPRDAVLFLAAPAALFLGLIGLASLGRPVLIPRVTIWLGVPLAGLLALALRERPNQRLLAAPLLLCIAIGLGGVWLATPLTKEDWRGLLAELSPHLDAGDTVVLGMDSFPYGVAYYGGPRDLLRWQPTPPGHDALLYAADHFLPIRPIGAADLAGLARAGHVWLILGALDQERRAVAASLALPPPREVLTGHAGLHAWRW